MSEYEKDWKYWKNNISPLQEDEIEEVKDPLPKSPFQKELFKTHPKDKKELIGQGGSKYKGGPYKFKVSYKRSKSAPPIGEGKIRKLLKEFQMMYDLSDLNVKDHLNFNIWDENGEHIHAEIGNKLTEVAKDFFASLKFPRDTEIIDIKFTGSLANYNWTESSDIDLHIVVDLNKISRNREMIRDYVNSKKSLWNERHDVIMKGYEVEVYIENISERHYSTGVYSLMNNEWIVRPNPKKPIIDDTQILTKINSFQTKADKLKDTFNRGEYETAYLQSEDLLDKLKRMRISGLVEGGEFSVENLTYKALRKVGVIDEIFDMKYDSYDEKMSLGIGKERYGTNPVKQGQITGTNL
jgi:predicted nucleotidyltransferase